DDCSQHGRGLCCSAFAGLCGFWEGTMRLSSCARVCGAVLLVFCAGGLAWAQNTPPPLYTPANAGAPLSTRVVNYQIDARLNADKKTIDATEYLTYKNLTGKP